MMRSARADAVPSALSRRGRRSVWRSLLLVVVATLVGTFGGWSSIAGAASTTGGGPICNYDRGPAPIAPSVTNVEPRRGGTGFQRGRVAANSEHAGRRDASTTPSTRVVATEAGAARARVKWTYGDPGSGAMGATDAYGNITIRPGMSPKDFTETLKHESVHSFLSPRRGPFLDSRARLGAVSYERSHALRFIEETAAETYGTGSLRQGLSLARTEYGVSLPRAGFEAGAYLAVTAGAAYGTYEWLDD